MVKDPANDDKVTIGAVEGRHKLLEAGRGGFSVESFGNSVIPACWLNVEL